MTILLNDNTCSTETLRTSGVQTRKQEIEQSGGAPDGIRIKRSFRVSRWAKPKKLPWSHLAIMLALLLTPCTPSILFAQTFAEKFNPSGNPIGGGPGYSKIPNPGSADYVLGPDATAADLLRLAKQYYEDDGTLITPASAASAGSLIWIDSAAELDLDGYNRITFNDGVTLASNRGEHLGGGKYAPGALLMRNSMWPNPDGGPQMDALFMAWSNGRLTGFRALGPYDLDGVNASRTTGWLGGATFFAKRRVAGTFELDNNEIYGWPDFAVTWYHTTSGDAMHHNWIHHNRQSGWGYGLYPGRPYNSTKEVTFLTEYNLFQENKHSTDGNSARPTSWHNLKWTVRGNIFLGKHGQAIVHAHNNDVGGCRYSGWKIDFIRNMILQPGEKGEDFNHALPPPGGYLNVEELYLDRATRSRTYISRVSGDQIDPKDPNYNPNWIPNCSEPHGKITSFDIRTNLSGATIPQEGSIPSATTLTEGEELTLNLSGSSDPDGHAITHHEIIWGDGKSITDPAHREIVYGPLAQHTYAQSGTYIVRVTAFNEYGIPSRETYHTITVEPSSKRPLFVAFVGTNWPSIEGTKWPGYYSARLLVNGHVVMNWRDVASFSGYERIEWDASPIDGDDTFELTMEIRVDKAISDPGGTEPGDIKFFVDRFYLFGRTGALYAEDLFLSNNNVSSMIITWGGGGSSSLFDNYDRAVGPGYGYALAVPNNGWVGRTKGDLYRFKTNAKGLDISAPREPAATVAHSINLQQGWNHISSYVAPKDSSLKAVFSDVLANVALVKDEAGKVFMPQENIDQLATWDPREAYMVYINSTDTLQIEGVSLSSAPPAIPLEAGWNQIPYLNEVPLPIDSVLSSISAYVVMVKNHTGQTYLPGFGINDIGMMQPGQGYLIYMSQPTTLVYTSSGSKTRSSLTNSPDPGTSSNASSMSPSADLHHERERLP